MSQPQVEERDSEQDGGGEVISKADAADVSGVVSLTDRANQQWLDSPERTREPITEWSSSRLCEFGEQLHSKLDSLDDE